MEKIKEHSSANFDDDDDDDDELGFIDASTLFGVISVIKVRLEKYYWTLKL